MNRTNGTIFPDITQDNSTQHDNGMLDPQSDSIWILSSTFIIFTMQSGFGLLESGSVSMKNEVNIMVKNAVDVIFGGLTYWMFGYGFSFGELEPHVNPFCGWGDFFVNSHDSEEKLGWVYSKFFFQASFATTATTIVSGGMAERTKLESYIIFSLANTFVFCFPAHWMWGKYGFLAEMGAVDIAGAGPVHLVGGVTAFVATVMLKPRHQRYKRKHPEMGSPTNAILGMFMLWWGWLGFNCGSTFGISGQKWKLAARSAVSTLCASMAGGFVGILLSYVVKKRKFDVTYLINGVLGSLVGITAFCALAQPWEGLVIGAIGGFITNVSVELLDRFHVDDPVGCVGTHAAAGMWSLLSVGFFARKDMLAQALEISTENAGLFQGGGFYLLGVQALAVACMTGWTLVASFLILKCIDVTIGLRIPLHEELLGADIVEHGIGERMYDKTTGFATSLEEEISSHPTFIGMMTGSRNRRKSLGKRVSFRNSESAFAEAAIGEFEINDSPSQCACCEEGFCSIHSGRPIAKAKRKSSGCFSTRILRKRRRTKAPITKSSSSNGAVNTVSSQAPGDQGRIGTRTVDGLSVLSETNHSNSNQNGLNELSYNHLSNGYSNTGYGFSIESLPRYHSPNQLAGNNLCLRDMRDDGRTDSGNEMTYI